MDGGGMAFWRKSGQGKVALVIVNYRIFPKIRPWADFFQLSFLKTIV
jgi:hypothetical protein